MFDRLKTFANRGGGGLNFSRMNRHVTLWMVFVAFASLVTTGELNPVATVVFVTGWILAYVLKGPPGWWSPWLGLLATVAVLVLLSLTARNAFFISVLYLLLFLVISKCFTLRRSQDFLQAQLLSFFMFLSTAVVTVAFHFIFFFLAYVILATLGLVLYAIVSQRERLESTRKRLGGADGARSDAAEIGTIPARVLGGGFWLAVCLVGLIVVYFMAIPHVSLQQLDSPMRSPQRTADAVSGFSDEVTLGQFGRIRPDATVVMRVELDWPEGAPKLRPGHLRIRGVALGRYEGRRWSSGRRESPALFNRRLLSPNITSAQRGAVTHLTIYQDPKITFRIFSASIPLGIDLKRPLYVRYNSKAGTGQVASFGTRDSAYSDPFVYEVRSKLVAEATPLLTRFVSYQNERRRKLSEALGWADDSERLRELTAERRANPPRHDRHPWLSLGPQAVLSPRDYVAYTRLPKTPMIARIADLSGAIASDSSRPETILKIMRHMRRNFEYTLEQDPKDDSDPIERFVFDTQRGHCEYFATAVALMLRTRGIPTRLINGFYTTEWQEASRLFIVKQSDAHTWVEAWIDDLGWLTIDPTPPGSAGRAAYGEDSFSWVDSASEYFRIQWQRLVIDYSQSKQNRLLDFVQDQIARSRIIPAVFDPSRFDMFRGDGSAREDSEEGSESSRVGLAIDLLILLALIVIGGRLARKFWPRRGKATSGPKIDYLETLLRRLEAVGWKRRPSQTPLEFISEVLSVAPGTPPEKAPADPPLAEGLSWLLDLYYRHRFAGAGPNASELRRARDLASTLNLPVRADRA